MSFSSFVRSTSDFCRYHVQTKDCHGEWSDFRLFYKRWHAERYRDQLKRSGLPSRVFYEYNGHTYALY